MTHQHQQENQTQDETQTLTKSGHIRALVVMDARTYEPLQAASELTSGGRGRMRSQSAPLMSLPTQYTAEELESSSEMVRYSISSQRYRQPTGTRLYNSSTTSA